LGHRSILADPRKEGIQDIVNRRVKFREAFRPFAPSVLLEDAATYFDLPAPESPFMLLVCPVRDAYRSQLPGITHVDGTARVQTVDRTVDPLFADLLEAFKAATGIPVVLNTSFNLRGEPIVETPLDAVRCFVSTQMDYLVLGRMVVKARKYAAMVPVRLDLRIALEGSIGAETCELTPKSLRVGAADSDVLTAVAPELMTLLRLIDGSRSVAVIAEALSADRTEVEASLLLLYRNGWITWKGTNDAERWPRGLLRP
jgi:carbamoyltransferase